MTTVPITLLFADGASRRFPAMAGQSVASAAAEAGLHLLTDCSNGQCGTCTAQLISGDLELGDYDRAVLPDADRKAGAVLTCVSRVSGPCAVELPYDLSEATAEELPPIVGRIAVLEHVALETLRLEVDVDQPVDFQPGQYMRLRGRGEADWRSYSMANASGAMRLVFFVRLVEGGVFSTWLTTQARVGAELELSEPHGSFFLRHEPRPRLFVAGGTGLAPFLSMLEAIAADSRAPAARPPTTLLLGARSGEHLFALDQLERLRERLPDLQVKLAAETAPPEQCHAGYATDLIATLGLDPATRIYLCGPPPMVEAGRAAAQAVGLARGDMLCERFN
ncbi:MAG: 2Fe-2S iron-sulfur cluster binding domain-containing protein [Comamonadaceae bacterium]|nr:MAG: 2Fe-2S iron-sulfur cluster binding domain-containing protein [Comamonadaceae bacterium]